MKKQMTGVAALVVAFVAGMIVATALGGGMVARAGKTTLQPEATLARSSGAGPGQEVIVDNVINPRITEGDIALLRQDLRAKKMQVIGQNMPLTDGEAAKFWPVYNHYVKDLRTVNDQKYALLKQYAEMWETMSDEDAMIYVRHWLEADGEAQALRLKYVPVVSNVLPGRKAATFFQLDRRLNMIVDLQLFSQIPLARLKE